MIRPVSFTIIAIFQGMCVLCLSSKCEFRCYLHIVCLCVYMSEVISMFSDLGVTVVFFTDVVSMLYMFR